jgi:C1A family cysteine protease
MNTIGKKDETFEPSRLFFYYQERVIENSVNQDAGADVIDGESYVQTYGICAEKTWPYNPMFFTENPPISAYEEAPKHKISSYVVLPCGGPELIVEIKRAINNQQPVLIAVAIYESFEGEDVARTGKVPMPIMDRENCLGGHEMCLIGYDDALQCGMVLNSWGDAWGDKGICYIPYEYLMNPSLGQEFTVFQL